MLSVVCLVSSVPGNTGFDQQIIIAVQQDQMLNIIPANKHKFAPCIYGLNFNHTKALISAPAADAWRQAHALSNPGTGAHQPKHENQRQGKTYIFHHFQARGFLR